ncbi:hypothetical protein TNCV_418061 [Trichonephila clavipes]|nr:hypothetical protein TNCV_418061 [Trichonephila clavipes]
MKISSDGQRSYLNSPNIQLSLNHIFNCPSTLAELHNIKLNSTDHQLLCLPKDVDIARAIWTPPVPFDYTARTSLELYGQDNKNLNIEL